MKDTDSTTTAARKPGLNWRFEFGSYGQTRDFLDQLSDLSKHEDYYPNVSFGKTYVNVSIDAEGQAELGDREATFVKEMHAFAGQDQA